MLTPCQSFRFQSFREALPLAERLESDMSSLEKWLDDRTSEVNKREEDGFPEDVDAEIKWNKVSLGETVRNGVTQQPFV